MVTGPGRAGATLHRKLMDLWYFEEMGTCLPEFYAKKATIPVDYARLTGGSGGIVPGSQAEGTDD
jgi:hypothetical protein